MKHPSLIQQDAPNFVSMTSAPADEKLKPIVQEEGYVFRPLPDYMTRVSEIYAMLPNNLSKTFAPPESAIAEVLKGYDPHFLLITSAADKSAIRGLLMFN